MAAKQRLMHTMLARHAEAHVHAHAAAYLLEKLH